MKHAHTAGKWSLDMTDGRIYARHGASFDSESELVERIATMRPTCVTDRWEADGQLLALAPTAPHDCDVPGCPGAENKRRLEAASKLEDALYELLEQTRNTSRFRAFGIDTSKLTLANMKAVLALTKAQDAKVGG